MTNTQTGQCHCGAIRLKIPTEIKSNFSCHCETCQKLVSGGRLLGAIVSSDDFSFTGDVAEYRYKGGSGSDIILSFCPKCSTQMFTHPTAHDGLTVIRSNALPTPKDFTPDQFIFTEEACPWDKVAI